MLELAVFQNGAVDLPSAITNGTRVNAGTLAETSESYQRILINQIRQGILAEELGFNYYFMTEHHMQPEGVEFSPNPLVAETAIAARTKSIRLGQMANILTWHHPVRLAEQGAMLDVISGGRLEFGAGRGYQSRETEVLGGPMGATIQDQERNRSFFQDCYEIIMKAWTQPSFSHSGEFFRLPPNYTKWGNPSTLAYFSQDHVERNVDDVLDVGPPDMYSAGPPVYATTTTLKEISVYPQPLQKPYPPIWQPVTSPRSIQWAAENAINCYTIPEPNSRLKANVALYYEHLEKNDWPDRLNRPGPFKFGYDADVKRGFTPLATYTSCPPARGRKISSATRKGWRPPGPTWAHSGSPPSSPTSMIRPCRPTSRSPRTTPSRRVWPSSAPPIRSLSRSWEIKESVGYEDFLFTAWFEQAGYRGEEVEEQMHMFAEQCIPQLADACGGLLENPDVAPAFAQEAVAT